MQRTPLHLLLACSTLFAAALALMQGAVGPGAVSLRAGSPGAGSTVPAPAGTALPGSVQDAAPAWSADVTAAIEAQLRRDGIPGLSCAIGVGDALAYRRGFGLADVENQVPATAATVYRLASISKPITAIAAMQLAEAGTLDLDRDVHEIVPAWPEKQWPVTTRQLLAHLGGVRHYRGEGESTHHYENQTQGLERFAQDPLLHEPGTRYHYSTYGFSLVAAVVEAAAQKPFAQVVEERIAGPGGAATLQDDDVRRIIPGRAQGYVRVDGELRNSELMDGSYKLGGGGLCCSAEDLVRVMQALRGGRLLGEATLAAMWTPQKQRDGKVLDYALGFGIGERRGRRVILHSGAQSRVSTMLYLLPDEPDGPPVTIVLLCNLEHVRLLPLAQKVADLVVESGQR
ncbi:MAG TPA: serine hydrolase domain-containing protein [Planctomycetota bacterium]|nr:serine hydrolase domain-containing protein [Planctomycetota bacterium]